MELNKISDVKKRKKMSNLRIIGTVYTDKNSLKEKDLIGYAIYHVRKNEVKLMNVAQTKLLIQQMPVENAKIEEGKIVNTECKMDKLLKFDTTKQVIGNHGITILSEIVGGDSKEYLILDMLGKVSRKPEKELLIISATIPLINAKKVPRNNNVYISSIRGEFPTMSVEEFQNKSKVSENKDHLRHLEKVESAVAFKAGEYICFYKDKAKNSLGYLGFRKHYLKKDYNIFLKEGVEKKYPIICKEIYSACGNEKVLYLECIALYRALKEGQRSYTGNFFSIRLNKFIFTSIFKSSNYEESSEYIKDCLRRLNIVKQVSDKEISLIVEDAIKCFEYLQKDVLGKIQKAKEERSKIKNPSVNLLLEREQLNSLYKDSCNGLKTWFANAIHYLEKANLYNGKLGTRDCVSTKGYEDKKVNFGNVKTLESFGFSLSPSFDKIYPLFLLEKYLGENDFEDFKKYVTCLGDIFFATELFILKKDFYSIDYNGFESKDLGSKYNLSWKVTNNTNFHPLLSESLMIILSIYNPKLAKWLNNKFKFTTLDVEELSDTDFKLSLDSKSFYKSGGKFNKDVISVGSSYSKLKYNKMPEDLKAVILSEVSNLELERIPDFIFDNLYLSFRA